MSNLQPNCCSKIDFQIVDQHVYAHSQVQRWLNLCTEYLQWRHSVSKSCLVHFRTQASHNYVSRELMLELAISILVSCLFHQHKGYVLWIYYTDPHMCGSTLLVPPLYLKTSGNLCQSQNKDPDNVKKTSGDFSTKFCGQPSLLSSPGQPSFPGVLISPISPKEVWRICVDHIKLWAVVVCEVLFNNIVLIMLTTVQPEIIENDIKFSGFGLSQREMSWTIGVSQGASKNPTLCLWEQQSYLGTT